MIRAQELQQEVRRTTEAIHRVFAVEGDLEEADVEKLHGMLVACLEAVNGRLRQCDELMRKGLRQEALQECERPPNVLELVTELDLPEWDAWADYVRQFGIPPQPSLLIDVAAELNEAYAQAQTLDQLMRSFRLHALARSPLSTRLAVLRSIAARDPDNPIWREDLNSYEAARLREVGAELQRRSDARDVRGVAALRAELENPAWQNSPPGGLIERTAETHKRLVVESAREQLAQLVGPIDAAFSSFDVAAAEQLRDRWNELAETAELPLDDALRLKVGTAFEWLDQEHKELDRQASLAHALAELAAALDDAQIEQAELRRLLAAAERYDGAIPDRLMRRFDQRMADLDLADRRRARLTVSAVIGVLLLVGAATAWTVRWQLRVREVDSFVASLQKNEQDRTFQQGLDLIERAQTEKPYLVENAEVLRIKGALEAERAAAEADARRFDSHLRAALDRIEQPQWDNVQAAKEELSEAAKIDVDGGGKLRLVDVRRKVQQASDQVQAEVDAAFLKEFEPIKRAVASLNALSPSDLQDLLSRARELNDNRPRVSQEAKTAAQLSAIVSSLENRRISMNRQRDEQDALAQIGRAVGDGAAYGAAIRRYLELHSNGDRANGFKTALEKDLPLLPTVDAWNTLADDWKAVNLTTTKDMESVQAVLNRLKSEFAEFPHVTAVLKLQEYIASTGRRSESMNRFGVILSSMEYRMDCVQRVDGSYIYFFEQPRYVPDGIGAKFIVKPLTNAKDLQIRGKDVSLRFDKLMDSKTKAPPRRDAPEADAMQVVKPSPQKRVIAAAKEKRGELTYEADACRVLHLVLRDTEIDPILQTRLLQELIECVCQGSAILQEHLRPMRAAIDTDKDLAEVNWLDFNSAEVAADRNVLRAKLAQLRNSANSPAELYKAHINEAVEHIVTRPPRLPQCRWIAVLSIDGSGQWTCQARALPADLKAGKLVVVDKKEKDTTRLHEIGMYEHKRLVLRSADAKFYEGRPVFLLQEL